MAIIFQIRDVENVIGQRSLTRVSGKLICIDDIRATAGVFLNINIAYKRIMFVKSRRKKLVKMPLISLKLSREIIRRKAIGVK